MKKRCEELASSGDGSSEYEKSGSPPQNDLFIEWTYTYDLDSLNFIVDSKAHFDLQAIAQVPSDEWIRFISADARGDRCLSLDTPPSLIGQFFSSSAPFLGGDPVPSTDQFVPTSTISPSTWSNPLTPHHRRLMLAYAHLTIAETYCILSMFPRYSLSSIDLQDLAISFLEAIIPNNQAIVANRQSPTLKIFNDEADPRDRSPWFWYRGCLILLAKHLDVDERFQVYVQAVASRAKSKNRDRCTAILWSIQHVAVVEISGGSVSHSDPIPLLAAYGSDEEGFISALHLLWHYLPYPRSRTVDERATSQGAGSSNFGNFPIEIVMKIMAFTDQLHYPKYQFLSHGFFSLWWKQLRLASYTILPDAEEIEDTSRCLSAYSVDADEPVMLRLKYLWGKTSGSIWRSDATHRDKPTNYWWDLHEGQQIGRHIGDDEVFSEGSTETSYRLQRFYSYWPEDLSRKGTVGKYTLPRVSDKFSSRKNILLCEAEPM